MTNGRLPELGIGHPLYQDQDGCQEGVIVVFHGNRDRIARKTGPTVVSSCEVVMFDAPEPMTAFERTQAQYEGLDSRQLPTVGFDDDLSDLRLDYI